MRQQEGRADDPGRGTDARLTDPHDWGNVRLLVVTRRIGR